MALRLLHRSHEDQSLDLSTHVTRQGSPDCSPSSKYREGDRGYPMVVEDT